MVLVSSVLRLLTVINWAFRNIWAIHFRIKSIFGRIMKSIDIFKFIGR